MIYSFNEIPKKMKLTESLAPCNYMDESHIQNVERN